VSTESTSVPSPSGPARRAGQAGRVTIAPPRDHGPDAPDRLGPPSSAADTVPVRRGLPLIAADLAGVLPATALTEATGMVGPGTLGEGPTGAVLAFVLGACVTVLNGYAGLYRTSLAPSALDQLPALAARIALAWCVAAAVLTTLLPAPAGWGLTALLCGVAIQAAVACGCRGLVYARGRAAGRVKARSALVVGTGAQARKLAALLVRHPEYGLRPVGIAGAPAAGSEGTEGAAGPLPVLSTVEEIHRAVIQNGVREAVFVESGQKAGSAAPESPDAFDGADTAELVALFRDYGCDVLCVGEGSWEPSVPRARMTEHLWGFPCRRIDAVGRARRGTRAKRLLDIAVSAPALIAVSPVLLGCALAVRLCDGPGVLFRQERVGQDGQLFTLLKFRTLRPSDDQEAATRWSIAGDNRMSTVGNILRRTSLDELPQLWNVLRGDMSLVGPRPERPHFVANFSKTLPGYAARHRMPVGITGLAQVHGLRGDTSIEDRSRFDNHYIDHWSLWQDVCILLRTAASLARPAGS
jgi:exopolysaccharide biosynthesis polyprenyl glycosylphosphotransferase